MRTSRLKLKGQSATYHCVTRVVGGAMLLDRQAKEELRKQLWSMSAFCGVEILAYCIMTNHFHVLLRVPEIQILSDEKLLQRFTLLYRKTKGRVETLEAILEKGGKAAELERRKLFARMGDVSLFMKELKQRFTIWYNRNHERTGTLWAERYKSVLIEDASACLRTVSAYIDLNPVRAGLVEDPKDYPFCGYAEAVAENAEACAGLCKVLEVWPAKKALSEYRKILFSMGPTTAREGQKAMDRKAIKKVVEEGGELPVSQVLRLKVRYFTDGMVLGSKEFVNQVFESNTEVFGKRRKTGSRPLRGLKDSGLTVIRDLRKGIFS